MKRVGQLSPGEEFAFAGVQFVVLDKLGGGIFCLLRYAYGSCRFQEEDNFGSSVNDYTVSSIREHINAFAKALPNSREEACAMLKFPLDLLDANHDKSYGTLMVRAAPLTDAQYSRYSDYIPTIAGEYWLATPAGYVNPYSSYSLQDWRCSVLCIGADGSKKLRTPQASGDRHFIRPAICLDESTLVVVANDDADEDPLSKFTDEELLNELKRRLNSNFQ